METIQLEAKAQEYVRLFQALQKQVSDEHVAAVILEQLGKDSRMQIIAERNGALNGNGGGNGKQSGEPATANQIGYLKSLGVTVPAGISKARASKLIDEALGNGR